MASRALHPAYLAGALLLTCLAPGAAAQKYRGVPDQALTINLLSRMFDLDGQLASVQEDTVAFREDGSKVERTVFLRPDPITGELARETEAKHVWDRRTRQDVGVFGTLRTKITLPLDEGKLKLPEPSAPGCEDPVGFKATDEAAEPILGFAVVKVRFRREQDDGTVFFIEQWRAPELGCLRLRSRSSFARSDGTVFGRTEEEAVAVVFGAPDSSLFEIPEGYTEQSEMLKAERATTFSWRRGDP